MQALTLPIGQFGQRCWLSHSRWFRNKFDVAWTFLLPGADRDTHRRSHLAIPAEQYAYSGLEGDRCEDRYTWYDPWHSFAHPPAHPDLEWW